jgi:hypothetical protein
LNAKKEKSKKDPMPKSTPKKKRNTSWRYKSKKKGTENKEVKPNE